MVNLIKIAVIPGDGVGPEVTAEAIKVLKKVSELRSNAIGGVLDFAEYDFGGKAIDTQGVPLPQATLEACKSAQAVLLGAVGGPQWPRPVDANDASKGLGPRPEQGLLDLRQELELYANLRPMSFASDSLLKSSPLKYEVAEGAEFMMIRELIGGVYFGKRQETDANGQAWDTTEYSVDQVKRVARLAGLLATAGKEHKKIHSIDKANVMATSRLWRKVVTETIEAEFPGVELQHHLVDAAAMLMVKNPRALNGIILTENMFGDILSDESSVIPGSLGLLPSASLGGIIDGKSPIFGMYEPIHGSAPDIAGNGVANPIGSILSAAMLLRYSLGREAEANAIEQAVRKVLDDDELNGYGMRTRDLGGECTTTQMGDAVVRALGPMLNGLNAEDLEIPREILLNRPAGRRGLTISEKIILHNAIGLEEPGNIKPGDMVCVKVDWTLASELTWKGMDKTYAQMGNPGVHRNDRFWLAIDHTVDPRIMDRPLTVELVDASEKFSEEAQLVDFYKPNYTILHTEFYRQRAQPGQLIIGADSHTCSAGAVGSLAIGMGAADVVMPMVTGETWLQVPETVEIRFVNEPQFGIGGKDIILQVLGTLGRNTVAFERAVEYTGPGLKYMSCDARFACANMATEFGGIAGVCEADNITAAFVSHRKNPEHRNKALYFKPDEDAEYAESHIIDLSKIEPLVALYPSPDNVVPASQAAGTELDGVFIGACTTAEEDLIFAALVLEAGLNKGLVPVEGKNRRVTPGSVPILAKLRRLGLADIYQRAGFDIGAPGCSYCLGVAADIAGKGEVWLSSQNRNFKNRMGPGSICNLASSATVAASSFGMKITDPTDLVNLVNKDRYKEMLSEWLEGPQDFVISEPNPTFISASAATSTTAADNVAESASENAPATKAASTSIISGKVQRFGDNIDTDAIIPAQFMPGTSDEDLGTHAFQHTHPEFRERVKQGFDIVVAGIGFGSGSSREEAPRALKGAGTKAVIAKSFAFIYSRNQPNMALLGICLKDEKFYELAVDGAQVDIDLPNRTVSVAGVSFPFTLSLMEERLISGGGVTEMYKLYGKSIFRAAISSDPKKFLKSDNCSDKSQLAW
ncbi:putative aconitate hydratase [Zancudomyces culisetae]|uniref:3-isopropylmalate dehydrogenase n=1 Tax=Zancudomyces culisetae TaxID=1213189 RepID=A0A1R1PBY0_ZANCU|nr:putative aconitate hydratase [Zancudomyces culisetae]|eukprot:OMH78463.1 putative aconitate hydratase [Zancudomyces culisetae]